MRPAILFAPAKLNLGLRVTGRYANGYHHLESLFVPVTLYDRITLLPAAGDEVRHDWRFAAYASQVRQLAQGAVKNPLLAKAITFARARQTAPGAKLSHLRVTVEKRIPSPSGLGGASADAAALIAYLIGLTGPGETSTQLLAEVSQLGADIPYFLQYGLWGSAAQLNGVGAQLQPVDLPGLAGVVAVPSFGFSTAAMFGYFRTRDLPAVTEDNPPEALQSKSALRLNEIRYSDERFPGVRVAQNDFEQAAAAVFPKEAQLLSAAQAKVAQAVRQIFPGTWLAGLTGSGPALYAVTDGPVSSADLKRLSAVLTHRLGALWQVYPIRSHRR
ncbi:MAG: 4-(cytidine 5'-diphospho)-2-C-methyl-D-erythritol kinase [Spirochaetota bacterium]